MLVDANVLLYAVDESSAHHHRARDWLVDMLNGDRRVALAWPTLGAFLRIATHPRIFVRPLPAEQAWRLVAGWLAQPVVWIPPTSIRTASILGGLVERYRLTGNAIPDAQLAALAIEHGLAVVSVDTDFARFAEITWVDPLR
jgi:uncharacterized protein